MPGAAVGSRHCFWAEPDAGILLVCGMGDSRSMSESAPRGRRTVMGPDIG